MTLIFFGALFSLILAISGKSNYSYMFFFMCLIYAVYLNHPLINLCFSMGGNFSYVFEYFCTHFVYLMVIMLQNRLCNLNKNVSSISEICGSVFCAIAFVYGVFTPYLSAPLCTVHMPSKPEAFQVHKNPLFRGSLFSFCMFR